MLAIRLQRLGRKALPIYRLAVQESRRHPSSGRVIAYVGAFNPHTKEVTIDKEKVGFYLKNGAQPTSRVVRLLTNEKIELPAWVKQPQTEKKAAVRNLEKLRKHRPAENTEAAVEEKDATDVTAEENKSEESTEKAA